MIKKNLFSATSYGTRFLHSTNTIEKVSMFQKNKYDVIMDNLLDDTEMTNKIIDMTEKPDLKDAPINMEPQ